MRSSSADRCATARRVGDDAQRQAARRRLRRELGGEAREQRRRAARGALGRQRAGFEPRQVEQLLELPFERARRRAATLLDQRRHSASRARAASAAT